jgi:hypothetical protein
MSRPTPSRKLPPLNLNDFAVDAEDFTEPLGSPDRARVYPFRPQRFLAGPLSWDLLNRAAALPGRALHLWLVLNHRHRLTRGKDGTLSVGLGRLGGEYGMGRWAAWRALRALERAGLVTVSRRGGHGLKVMILNIKEA